MKALLLTLLITGIIILLVIVVVRLQKSIDGESIKPSEVGLIADLDLDESYQLDCILRATWAYFDLHPRTLELTEIHSIINDNACQIFEEYGESEERTTVVLFSLSDSFAAPDYLKVEGGVARMEFKGGEARRKVVIVIKEILQITEESRVPYQLAGSDGPIRFFLR